MLEPQPQSRRLLALDIFRGMTIFFMIVVNTPGSWNYVYAPLLHAEWNGLTPTDLVFPFFVYIVGCAMSFSFAKFDRTCNLGPWYRKILSRTLLIFSVGIFLNWYPFYDRSFAYLLHRKHWRKPHLIGLAYDFQQLTRLPPQPWDVPLTAVVTDSGWHRFKRPG